MVLRCSVLLFLFSLSASADMRTALLRNKLLPPAYDYGQGAQNAEYIHSGVFSTPPPPLLVGSRGSIDLSGHTEAHIRYPDSPELSMSGAMTIEVWVYPYNKVSEILYRLVSKGGPNGKRAYVCWIDPVGYFPGLTIAPTASSGVNYQSTNAVPTNQWTHLAFVYTPSTSVEIYQNGIRTDIFTDSIMPAQYSENGLYVFLGIYSHLGTTAPTSNNHFRGRMADVRIWNVARTAGHIQRDFMRTLTGYEEGLVAYWRLDETF